MNLSRNQYGYRDPTAEKAITHIMSEQKRKERRRRKKNAHNDRIHAGTDPRSNHRLYHSRHNIHEQRG